MAKPEEIDNEFQNMVIDMVRHHIIKFGIPSTDDVSGIRKNALELIKIYYPDQTKDCYITFPKSLIPPVVVHDPNFKPEFFKAIGTRENKKEPEPPKKRPWWKLF